MFLGDDRPRTNDLGFHFLPLPNSQAVEQTIVITYRIFALSESSHKICYPRKLQFFKLVWTKSSHLVSVFVSCEAVNLFL